MPIHFALSLVATEPRTAREMKINVNAIPDKIMTAPVDDVNKSV